MRNKLKRPVALLLASTLALSPIISVAESEYSAAMNLTENLSGLLDRAWYPDVPRRGATGEPTVAELTDAQTKIVQLRARLQQGFLDNLLKLDESLDDRAKAGTAEDPMTTFFLQLDTYFQAASRIEGLKIMKGEPVREDAWDAAYSLRFDIDALAQPRFLDAVALSSDGAVLLPTGGYDIEKVSEAIRRGSYFRTHLERAEGGKWRLVFELDPRFAADAERGRFVSRPELKSGLQYAGLFATTSLYRSLGLTRMLRGQAPTNLPDAPPAARQRFVSLRLAGPEMRREFRNALYAQTKPQIYAAIVDAAATFEKSPASRTLNAEFWQQFTAATGIATKNGADEMNAVNELAFTRFARTLSGLVNLTEVERQGDLAEFLVREARRISLRSMFVEMLNPGELSEQKVTPEQVQALEALLEEKSKTFTRGLLTSTSVAATVKNLQTTRGAEYLQSKRRDFQKRLEETSTKLRNFENEDINIGYLLAAQAGPIKAMQPTTLVTGLVKRLEKEKSYQGAYLKYKQSLYTYLRMFKLEGVKNLATVQIDDLATKARDLPFDPQALKDMPTPLAEALNPAIAPRNWLQNLTDGIPGRDLVPFVNPVPIPARNKDLMDLVQLGKLLKVNVFQKSPDMRPTVASLKFDNTLLGPVIRGERNAYLGQMERDLINSLPLLGAEIQMPTLDNTQAPVSMLLYKRLADPQLNAATKWSLVDAQLRETETRIAANQTEIDAQLGKIEALPAHATPGDLGNVSSEMQTLVSKASAIRFGLETFSSFDAFYQEFRREMELPGFARRHWEQFNTFTIQSSYWFLGLMALQMVQSKIPFAGPVIKAATDALTPVFGIGFSRMMPLWMGAFGISIADSGVSGYVTEPIKAETLRRYFECGSDAACVALYGDVADQYEKAMEFRREMFTNLLFIAAVQGAFAGAGAVKAFWSRPAKRTFEQAKRDAETLGIPEGRSLDRDILPGYAQDALRRANNAQDPVARELGRVTVEQTHNRLQDAILREAKRFVALEDRFYGELKQLGLLNRNWKDGEVLKDALENVERQYKAGQLPRSEYDSQRGTIMDIVRALRPAWQAMGTDPFRNAFYNSVFRLSSRASLPQLEGYRMNKVYDDTFLRRMEQFDGEGRARLVFRGGRVWYQVKRPRLANDRLENMLKNIDNEMQTAPEITGQRLEQLRRYLKGEVL